MGFFRGIKRIIKPHVDFPRWMGYRDLTNNGKILAGFAKKLFVIKQPEREETFEQAMARLQLSEADVQQRQRSFLKLAIVFCLLALAVYSYTFYLIRHQTWENMLLGLAAGCLCLGLAFRYHFWYFQLKQRQLGCTLQLWFTKGLLKR